MSSVNRIYAALMSVEPTKSLAALVLTRTDSTATALVAGLVAVVAAYSLTMLGVRVSVSYAFLGTARRFRIFRYDTQYGSPPI